MRVLLTLPGGCESAGQSAGCTGNSPGSCSVHTHLEKKAARHPHERDQKHGTDVSDKRFTSRYSHHSAYGQHVVPTVTLCLFIFSGMDVLQYNEVSFEMLASCFPEGLSPYMEFSQRLKIEGDYN